MPKTYTTIPTVNPGDAILASSYNTYQKDNVNNLIVPPLCVLTGFNTSQNFTHAAQAAVQFNGADAYDTDAMHDTVTNNTRITINTEGLYACSFYAQINNTGVTQMLVSMAVSGNGFAEMGSGSPISASAARFSVCGIVYATAGQYIESFVYQESTASATRQLAAARFSVAWLGRAS